MQAYIRFEEGGRKEASKGLDKNNFKSINGKNPEQTDKTKSPSQGHARKHKLPNPNNQQIIIASKSSHSSNFVCLESKGQNTPRYLFPPLEF